MLGAPNSSQIHETFTSARLEILHDYYISQSCFGLPRQIIRNNSDRIILLKQTLRDAERMNRGIRGYDMNQDEFIEMCREAWNANFNYLCIDLGRS